MAINITPDFWPFVEANSKADPAALRLKYHGKSLGDLDIDLAITQIECRRKFAKKLSETLKRDPRFLIPNSLSGEQATSDLLAQYHASLLEPSSTVLDMTAGLGIDTLHLAERVKAVTAIEIDQNKAQALAYNVLHLDRNNIDVVHDDCIEFLNKSQITGQRFLWDYIFIDPHRRGDHGQRLFALSDCVPDVISLLPQLRRRAHWLIIKASPMLDITRMAAELPGCTQILSIGTPTECKELVAIVDLTNDEVSNFEIKAVTLTSSTKQEFEFTALEEREAVASYAIPREGWFLNEPYPSVMKAAPYSLLSQRYGVAKLHPNTHLYVSEDLVPDFPGEALEIWNIYPFMSKHIKRLHIDYPQINVATRNFDMPAETLRKKLGVRDGGEMRLFAATAGPRQLMMVVKKPDY